MALLASVLTAGCLWDLGEATPGLEGMGKQWLGYSVLGDFAGSLMSREPECETAWGGTWGVGQFLG